ncbi:MAG TPA: antibiotic biosynthesis monooxygenase family protein [Actinomycetota bacterium]|nr:antibiotic biosynthesis monooxygenase family protein [Actinomycetota bacterium]
MSVYGTARFSVKPEALDRSRSAIEEFVVYVRANEPATRLYLSLEDQADPTRFLHLFVFEDEAAENLHANSDAVKRFTDALYPQTVDGVTFERFSPVGPA